MRKNRVGAFLVFWAFTCLAILPGCEGGAVVNQGKRRLQLDEGGGADVVRVALEPKGYGTIRGKVVFDGPPPPAKEQAMGPAECHAPADKNQWNLEEKLLVDGKGGVQNVVVFLKPGPGKFFDVPDTQRSGLKPVEVDQPYCAFTPRVFTLFTDYYDKESKELKSTGQKLVIVNNAGFSHNYSMSVDVDAGSIGGVALLPPGSKAEFDTLRPQNKPISVKCSIHSWMQAWGFVLDHPYAAVTKADGSFEIPNVPLGVDVYVVAWHEMANFFGEGGDAGKKMVLKDGDTIELPKLKVR